jgi:hypothetical protein
VPARHSRTSAPRRTRRHLRLLVVALAPLVVLTPLTALAADSGSTWSRSWTPPLALLSSYSGKATSTAGFKAIAHSIVASADQKLVVTAKVRTRWVDTKATDDSPNILQEGMYGSSAQVKLQIGHGTRARAHRAQCRIAGAGGSVLATGPAIDVADGTWHTVTCTKSPDSDGRTKVVVTVDGVAGAAAYSAKPVGRVAPPGELDLGGRSAVASTDSLDGWIRAVQIVVR